MSNFESTVVHKDSRVLIVDDSATNRFLLRGLLSKIGYEVQECASGVDCLRACEIEMPDIVVLDIIMPEMDGIDVCRRLRQQHSKEDLPIIFVTSKSESGTLAEGMEAGGNDYVTKPLDRGVFLARLENQLSMSRFHRKLEEQRLELIKSLEVQNVMGDVLPDALLIHDQDGGVLYSNQRLRGFCGGCAPATIEEAAGQIFDGALQWFHAKTRGAIDKNGQLTLEEELETDHQQYRNVQVVSKPVRLSDGRKLRLWLWRDVSHTRELERKIAQQVKLDTVSLFAAGVAHNFNNLLGSILGASELLRKTAGDNNTVNRCLSIIEKGVAGGKTLTEKLSSLVRRDVCVWSANQDALLPVVHAVADVQHEISGGRVAVHVAADEHIPSVNIDATNLMDIITNVVSNAIDATNSEGEVHIRVSHVPGERFVNVDVIDQGIGMDNDTLEQVFLPFFTTKNLDVKNGIGVMGNGLGLWNVYSLLKACGGDIRLSSAVGKGTQARLQLPVQSEEDGTARCEDEEAGRPA